MVMLELPLETSQSQADCSAYQDIALTGSWHISVCVMHLGILLGSCSFPPEHCSCSHDTDVPGVPIAPMPPLPGRSPPPCSAGSCPPESCPSSKHIITRHNY